MENTNQIAQTNKKYLVITQDYSCVECEGTTIYAALKEADLVGNVRTIREVKEKA